MRPGTCRVTSLQLDGQTISVTVTDQGPYGTARAIDLTPAAFTALNRLVLMSWLLALHCGFADADAPRIYHIVSPIIPEGARPMATLGARLMGFELAISPGRVAALRDCPAGWRIEIDNDAAWHATVSAHATVGAAALDVDALSGSLLFTPAPVAVAGTAGGIFAISGSATIMRDGNLTRLALHGLRLAATDGALANGRPARLTGLRYSGKAGLPPPAR